MVRGGGRQARPHGQGPGGVADHVLHRPSRREAGRRAAMDAPRVGPRRDGLVQGERFRRLRTPGATPAGRVRRRRSRRLSVRRPLPRAGRALCHLSVAANLLHPAPGRRRPVAGGGHRPAATPRTQSRRHHNPAGAGRLRPAPRPSQVGTRFARPGPAAGPPAGRERRPGPDPL